MLKLAKIAVTGGLSCGKTSVCRFFKELGASVVSADEIVHHLLSPQTALGQQVITLLGTDIVINQQIDRSQIAKKVFNNSDLLHSLENLLHPAVREEIEKCYQQANKELKNSLFIAEIPLLFETNSEHLFDYTIAVIADDALCQERFCKATGYTKNEYDKRNARQLPASEKARRADFVLYNNTNEEDLRNNVKKLYQVLIDF